MFHMEAFTSSIATSGANTFQQLSFLNIGNIIPQLNLGLNIPVQLPMLHSVFGVGVSLVHVRAQTPQFLPFPYPAFSPNNRGSAFESPPRIWDFSASPLLMKGTDELDIFVTQNSGGAETEYVAVNLTDGNRITPPVGRFFTVHGTASVTLTAARWTSVSWTFDQTIPAGRYAIVGARCFSASGRFFRVIPTEPPNYRPGGTMVQAYDGIDPGAQRYFDYLGGSTMPNWGVWVYTNSYVMPQCELFATAADTAEEIWFDMVLIGPAYTPSTAPQGI